MIPKPFAGRCATCKFWQGDKDKMADRYEKAINKNRFILAHGWVIDGPCRELSDYTLLSSAEYSDEGTAIVSGVFGCILYEPDK